LSKKEAALADGLNPDASSADNLIAEFRKRYVLRVPCMIRCFCSYAFFVAMRTVLPAVVLSFFLEVLREVLPAVFFFLVGIVMTDDEETMEMAAVSRWRQL
jgi:hypothetical protein